MPPKTETTASRSSVDKIGTEPPPKWIRVAEVALSAVMIVLAVLGLIAVWFAILDALGWISA
jgi:hypothetical protein